ncbi:phosphoesterase [Candidatus Mycoplasma haematobovis]|uniref:Phosphoesterase n=1 Tax=Candidatus Mycoplasma haematobovis TaxID=432608 RepID=A0A1A9QE30_9MOLU|nr:bifunctional oligoribonuclease/PAP phosphatase NrnA [Candidatus Mycoplasma haematobovis]OAL10737.1 phosphoesterase [Candidatus Mycoplasma haematobovis]
MLKNFVSKFLVKLNEYENIAIFVHIDPDFDAYASAFGLRKWLQDNFPNKNVRLMIPQGILREEEKFLFDYDKPLPSEKELKTALGILLDTPNTERVLTQQHIHCKELVIIDHHPKIKGFAQLEFIDPTYPAVSQILAEIFFYLEPDYVFNSELAQYLYAGIITDTNNFMSLAVLPSTYQALSKLVSKGLNRSAIHNFIFVKNYKFKLFISDVVRRAKLTNNGLVFAVVDKKLINKYFIKDFPHTVPFLENILNVEVWTTLTYDLNSRLWRASIRSKEIIINHIAKLYGGGGHKNAAATQFKRKSTYYKLLVTLDEYLVNAGYGGVTRTDFKFCLKFAFFKFFRFYKKL